MEEIPMGRPSGWLPMKEISLGNETPVACQENNACQEKVENILQVPEQLVYETPIACQENPWKVLVA